MTPLSGLLSAMTQAGSASGAEIPADWQQGRTTYGGLTAALCVAAALRALPDLPPLRSAQFAFVGPAGGVVRMETTVLRRGKSTVFAAVDLHAEAGRATHATLIFAADRQSELSYQDLPCPPAPPPEDCPPLFPPGTGPVFSQHFDYRRVAGASPPGGPKRPAYRLWLRHRDQALTGPDAVVALVALADAPPPAALRMAPAMVPISTMTWSLDLLALPEGAATGWCLLAGTADTVAHGYSTQDMTLWAQDGTPLLCARQSIAIFA